MTVKRGIDIAVSAAVLATIYPLAYIIIGTLIKLTSPGSVLFLQKRVGLHGKTFLCLKFRSMKVNGESDVQPTFPGDSRITAVGEFLRKTHIDELPQFINVLRGEMSMIGPRPHMLKDEERFSEMVPEYVLRRNVVPGITGLAQLNGYSGPVENRIRLVGRTRLDLWYAAHMTPGLDTYIFFGTMFRKLLGGKTLRKVRRLLGKSPDKKLRKR